MTLISKSITVFGLVLLAHACYSAHEHSALHAASATAAATTTAASGSATATKLPLDITIETLVALVVVSLGLVAGTPSLRPIQWREWAGKIEREGEDGFRGSGGEVERDFIGNPFRYLESRPGFVDIRRQRVEFASWVKSGGDGGGRAAK